MSSKKKGAFITEMIHTQRKKFSKKTERAMQLISDEKILLKPER